MQAPCAFAALLLTTGLLSACSGDAATPPNPSEDDAERHGAWRRVRLLVADADSLDLSVYDEGRAAVIERLEAPHQGTLRASSSGRHALLLGAQRLSFFKAGVTFFAHDDHYDLVKSKPKFATFSAPVEPGDGAVLSHLGWIVVRQPAINGGERAQLLAIREDSLNFDQVETLALATGAPAAGRAVAFGDGFVFFGDDGAVGTLTRDGALDAALGSCAAARAISVQGSRIAFECEPRTLGWIEQEDGARVSLRKVPLAHAVLATHVHPLRPAIALELADDTLVTVTPAGIESSAPRPAGACDVALEPSTGASWLVLDARGTLHKLDAARGEASHLDTGIAAFACADARRPRLALAPERAYVTDPNRGQVLDLDTRAMRAAEPIDVGGAPSQIVVLGIDLENVNASTVAVH